MLFCFVFGPGHATIITHMLTHGTDILAELVPLYNPFKPGVLFMGQRQKRRITRSDAAELSGTPLFAYRMFY